VIVPMKKVFIVARAGVRDRLLAALRASGVVHLEPVDPASGASADLLDALSRTRRAQRAISGVGPRGAAPSLDAAAATDEILQIVARTEQHRTRLGALHRLATRLAVWGDLRRDRLDALAEAGVPVRFYSVPRAGVGQVQAECVVPLAPLPGKRQLIGVVQRAGEPALPENAEPIAPPEQDIHAVRAEAQSVDAALAADAERLGELAGLSDALTAHERRLSSQAEVAAARAGGLAGEDLFALQGWAPAEAAGTLAADLGGRGLDAAIRTRDPSDDEEPPTLVRYPRWAKPIQGLFDILGTHPGYREFDVSVPFMIALPIFAGMLIGDGAYGLLFLLTPLLLYRKAVAVLGRQFTRLLIVIGGTTLAWGALNGSFFGVVLYRPAIPVNMTDASRDLVMRISFYMGAAHLSAAQLWAGAVIWPSLKTWSRIGWAAFIWGMLGVVKFFVLSDGLDWSMPWPYLLAGGAALAIVFDSPSRNPVKMLAAGVANFPLRMLSAFSDVVSYVRLMAVGLASAVLAGSFNELALQTGSWLTAVPVLVFGHALNLALCLLALFAHGVRLNMLEFSNNLGMQWTGYAYRPFSELCPEEIRP